MSGVYLSLVCGLEVDFVLPLSQEEQEEQPPTKIFQKELYFWSKRPYQILSLCKKDKINKTGFKTEGSYLTLAKKSYGFLSRKCTPGNF